MPLFDSMMRQRLLRRNLFAFHLASLAAPIGSSLVFGGVDGSRLASPVHWVRRTASVYWEVEMEDVYVDGVAQRLCPPGRCRVAIDTGTSLFTGPPAAVGRLTRTLQQRLLARLFPLARGGWHCRLCFTTSLCLLPRPLLLHRHS